MSSIDRVINNVIVSCIEPFQVQQSNLSVDIVEKDIIPNIWAGPPQVSYTVYVCGLPLKMFYSITS